jgi:phage-related protein
MIVTGLLTNLPALLEGIGQLVLGIVQALPQITMSLVQGVVNIFKGIWEAIKNVFAPVGEWFSNMWNELGNVPGLSTMKTMIEQVWGAIKSHITVVVDAIKNVVTTYWNTIKNVVGTVINAIKTVISSTWNTIKTIISNVMKLISSVLKGDWEGVKTAISNIINAIKSHISTVWNAIKSVISSIMNGIKSVVSSIWNGIKSVISSAIKSIKTVITSVWNGIKSTTSSVFNGIKSTASSAWNDIKNKMTSPIEKARDTIKGIVDKITGFFNNMKISIPKIKLPHIKISGKLSLNPPSVPKLSIEWYKKAMDEPYMFTEPTLFDYNPLTGAARGAGDAGDEVMIGKNTMLGMIRQAVAVENGAVVQKLERIISLLVQFFPDMLDALDLSFSVDGKELATVMAPAMNTELGKIAIKKGRGR